MHRTLRGGFSPFLLGAALLAQDVAPAGAREPGLADLAASCGLQQQADGSVLAVGTAYKATFAHGRVEFTPALGMVAPHDLPLALEVTHAGRGEVAPVGPSHTVRADRQVEFVRDELIERFDVRPEGLKQSFVFTQLPIGAGDLVVRARWTSDLRPEPVRADGGLSFTFPGAGGVTIGQVVGIDAHGRRAIGSLRCDGGALDFVLPADFVAQAALPLVVDPLLAPLVFVSATLEDDTQPDVAHMGAQYMVVWKRAMSASNSDILAQRWFDDLSGNSGGLLSLEASAVNADTPRVVSTTANNSWFVCWRQANDILGLKILSNGSLGSVLTIAGGADVQTEPDLAGDAFGGQAITIPVWRNQTTDSIEACVITLTTTPPTIGPVVTLVADTLPTQQLIEPAVSRSNPTQTWLLAYGTVGVPSLARTLRGQAFTSTLVPVGVDFPIAGSAGINAIRPAVGGDGRSWVVAYETVQSGPGRLVHCNTVRAGSGLTAIDPPRLLTPAGQILVGNPDFGVRLRAGMANQFAFAVVSTGVLNFACGPCTVVPDFSIGVVDFVGATSPLGDAVYPLAIPANPALAGQVLAAQFAHFGTSCLGSFQLTQGVQFTIE